MKKLTKIYSIVNQLRESFYQSEDKSRAESYLIMLNGQMDSSEIKYTAVLSIVDNLPKQKPFFVPNKKAIMFGGITVKILVLIGYILLIYIAIQMILRK